MDQQQYNAFWEQWGQFLEPGDEVQVATTHGLTCQPGRIKEVLPSTTGMATFRLEPLDSESQSDTSAFDAPVEFTQMRPCDMDAFFPIEDWQEDASRGDTRVGFEDWIEHQFESQGMVARPDAASRIRILVEAMQVAKVQLRDLAAGYPHKELCESLDRTLSRMDAALLVGGEHANPEGPTQDRHAIAE